MPLSSQLSLAPSPRSAADARRWIRTACLKLGRPELVEAAEVGISELVANAILHGRGPITVRLRGTASHPRVEVLDGSTEPPVPPALDEGQEDDEEVEDASWGIWLWIAGGVLLLLLLLLLPFLVVGALKAARRKRRFRAERESDRLKARLGEMLLERELLEQKIALLEGSSGPLARRRPRR